MSQLLSAIDDMRTTDYTQLAAKLNDATGVAMLNGPFGPTPITPQTARRLGCDADIIPALLASDGTILDLGRSGRTWSTAQRRAARLRDGGCVFPNAKRHSTNATCTAWSSTPSAAPPTTTTQHTYVISIIGWCTTATGRSGATQSRRRFTSDAPDHRERARLPTLRLRAGRVRRAPRRRAGLGSGR